MTPHGINVPKIAYYGSPIFVDRMKASKGWDPQAKGVVGADGWPTGAGGECANNFPLDVGPHNYTMIVLEGSATKGSVVTGNVPFQFTDGRATFDATGVSGHGIMIRVTPSPGSGRLRLALVRTDELAAYEAGKLFRPVAIDLLAGASCVRFMDLNQTNSYTPAACPTGAHILAWPAADSVTFNGVPMAVEHAAALCNSLGSDCWYNFPASVPQAEIERVLALMRSLLLPWLKLYVEWSNEVWNVAQGFPTGYWASKQPGGQTAVYAQGCAMLSQSLKKLALPNTAMMICWQFAGSLSGKQKVIDAFLAAGGIMDVVAGFAFAPYPIVKPDDVAAFAAKNDAAGLLKALDDSRAEREPKFAECVALAAKYGKTAYRYEESLSPFPADADMDFTLKALATPEAAAIMKRLWASADAAGMGFGCYYNASGTGQFGFAASFDDTTVSPVRQAWMAYNRRAWPLTRAQAPKATTTELSSLSADLASVAARLNAYMEKTQ